jgi:hypothetical protein
MWKSTVLFVFMLLSGCEVDGWVVSQSIDSCRDHKGIDYIELYFKNVICNDGKAINLKKIR